MPNDSRTRRWMTRVAGDLLVLCGMGVAIAGVHVISVPAAVVLTGLCLILIGLFS